MNSNVNTNTSIYTYQSQLLFSKEENHMKEAHYMKSLIIFDYQSGNEAPVQS
jgi:hypothetical protein